MPTIPAIAGGAGSGNFIAVNIIPTINPASKASNILLNSTGILI